MLCIDAVLCVSPLWLQYETCNAPPTGLRIYKLVCLTDLKQHYAEHKGAYTQLTKFSLLLMRVPGLHLFIVLGMRLDSGLQIRVAHGLSLGKQSG